MLFRSDDDQRDENIDGDCDCVPVIARDNHVHTLDEDDVGGNNAGECRQQSRTSATIPGGKCNRGSEDDEDAPRQIITEQIRNANCRRAD